MEPERGHDDLVESGQEEQDRVDREVAEMVRQNPWINRPKDAADQRRDEPADDR